MSRASTRGSASGSRGSRMTAHEWRCRSARDTHDSSSLLLLLLQGFMSPSPCCGSVWSACRTTLQCTWPASSKSGSTTSKWAAPSLPAQLLDFEPISQPGEGNACWSGISPRCQHPPRRRHCREAEILAAAGGDHGAMIDMLYRAMNCVREPSMIRVESDEASCFLAASQPAVPWYLLSTACVCTGRQTLGGPPTLPGHPTSAHTGGRSRCPPLPATC